MNISLPDGQSPSGRHALVDIPEMACKG